MVRLARRYMRRYVLLGGLARRALVRNASWPAAGTAPLLRALIPLETRFFVTVDS